MPGVAVPLPRISEAWPAAYQGDVTTWLTGALNELVDGSLRPTRHKECPKN